MSASAPLAPEVAAQDKGPSIIAASCAVTAISTLFVIARLYVRVGIIRNFQLDDYFVTASQIFGWLTVAFAVASVESGNGQHTAILKPDQLSGAVLWTMVGFAPGVMSFSIPKLAAITLLTRLLNPSDMHKKCLWVMGVMCVLILSGCIAILFGQCTPSRAQWDFSITEKTCINPYILVNYSIFAGAFSGFVDLYLAVWPATVLFSLQMNLKKKMALIFALGLGSVACIVAIYKCTRIPGLASPDFTYDTADLTIWTCVEGSTIIIATCIPTLRPLADLLFGRAALGGSSGDRHGYKHYGTERSNNTRDDLEMGGSKKRKIKGPYDLDTRMDLETRIDPVNEGSQEDILPRDGANPTSKRGDGIVRTQSVTIQYGKEDNSPAKKYEEWK
ncbi:uncharacterized protein F4822DRAFT_185906 [Hypoxylon trugodes]|uniref:uncharacterized protein n=1 Tax=Hypoxylon trugodes TaxID=326681 RepID=UPI002194508C|nr:uncharacterized protein F4822DRAFT_185906 [Hypoxylon trugodes]KAI1391438.1 hypothetical protein F4822DRAFT_185906 [Hypoxylon trugodes]